MFFLLFNKMEKRKVIIFTIITTILSLIMILFSYFGISRYLFLHLQSPERFVEKYNKLPKADNGRVVVSFTTTPDKIKKLKPMINSVLDQTVKVDQFALVIQDDDKNYDFPQYIKDMANIFPSGKDYGKGTKLIPILLKEKECDTTIIAIDDSMVYGQDFIYTMIEQSKKNPGSVLIDKKGNAMLVKPEYFGCDVIDRYKEKFDNDWFLTKAKDKKVVNYIENYKIIGF